MPDQNNSSEKNNRRRFLKSLGLIIAGIVAGSLTIFFRSRFQTRKPGKPVIKLTASNKSMELANAAFIRPRLNSDSLQPHGRIGLTGKRWVMVIDLSKCNNTRKCIQACQSAHQLRPEQFHINTLLMKDSPMTAPYYLPKQCQQCDNPGCVSVCPVNATFKRTDGIVLIDNERCIGCRICLAACPYSARIFNWFDPRDAEKYSQQPYDIELNVPQKRGTVSKCIFSADKLRKGELPYCVSACPNGVYWFGDENEDAVTNGTTKQTIRLSELISDNAGYRLMEELGQKPRVYYLPPKNRMFPFQEETINKNEENI